MPDVFLIEEEGGDSVVVSAADSQLVYSGASLVISDSTDSDGLDVSILDEPGQLVVTEGVLAVTDSTSLTILTADGGVTGPQGPQGLAGHSIDVHWDSVPPPPDAPGDEGDLWVVL